MGMSRWLTDRQRPGNWIDIAQEDEIPNDIVGWNRTIVHLFQVVFAPEIKRRFASGQIDEHFFLLAAQLLQREDDKQVRLNEEVRGIGLIKVQRPVEKNEPIFASDLSGFEGFDVEEAELDAGHFTMFWHGRGWVGSFDFRIGRAKAAETLKAASQFLDAAKYSTSKGHPRPSVDNLFSACEHVSKVHLFLHRSPAAKAKTHRSTRSAINRWGQLGNVNEDFLSVFNRMSALRPPARYDVAAQVELPTTADFEIVEREIECLSKGISHITKTRPGRS